MGEMQAMVHLRKDGKPFRGLVQTGGGGCEWIGAI